jgi:hypothetical protein
MNDADGYLPMASTRNPQGIRRSRTVPDQQVRPPSLHTLADRKQSLSPHYLGYRHPRLAGALAVQELNEDGLRSVPDRPTMIFSEGPTGSSEDLEQKEEVMRSTETEKSQEEEENDSDEQVPQNTARKPVDISRLFHDEVNERPMKFWLALMPQRAQYRDSIEVKDRSYCFCASVYSAYYVSLPPPLFVSSRLVGRCVLRLLGRTMWFFWPGQRAFRTSTWARKDRCFIRSSLSAKVSKPVVDCL